MDYYNELYHYGVKGQKWGVRRYQNADGSLTPAGKKRYSKADDVVLKKGSKTYHVTTKKNLELENRPIYVGSTQNDLKTYAGPYGISLFKKKMTNGDFEDPNIYLHEYTVKDDIRAPGLKTMKDRFDNIYDKHPDTVKRAMKGYYDHEFKAGNIKNNSSYEEFSKDKDRMFSLFGDKNLTVYLKYQSSNTTLPSVPSVILARDYVESFKKEKYSAILDVYDRGKFYSSEQPIVILEGKKYLENSRLKNMNVNEVINLMKIVQSEGYDNQQHFIKYSDM